MQRKIFVTYKYIVNGKEGSGSTVLDIDFRLIDQGDIDKLEDRVIAKKSSLGVEALSIQGWQFMETPV